MKDTRSKTLYSQFRMILNNFKLAYPEGIERSILSALLILLITFNLCSRSGFNSESPKRVPKVTEKVTSTAASFVTDDRVYREQIKSVQLHPLDAPVSPPFIELNSGASLLLSFDDLDADFKDYYYTIIHCNANWQPSDLFESDYINGFLEMNIANAESSFNTAIPYTNYQVQVPGDDMQPSLSGNYLLYVYEDADKDKPVLTRRFVVYEQLVRFRARVKESTIISERRYKQELDFDVVHPNYTIQNPYSDFSVALLQNHRWDNAITDLDPIYVKNNELTYDYDEENNFNGGNEFRHFDLKSLRYSSNEVGRIGQDSDGVPVVQLIPDEPRTFTAYRTDQDIDGHYLVKNDDAFDDATESEYMWVYFMLPMDLPFADRSVYIFGELSLWSFNKDFRMKYNTATKAYEAMVLLKQGYYNYHYAVVDESDPKADVSVLEGNHAQANNEFAIFAYHYNINLGYDRVVGAYFTNTFNR